MSAVEAFDPIGDQPPSGRPDTRRDGLRLLAARPARMSRFPFILTLLAIVALGMGGLVVVNTQIQTQSTQLAELQREAVTLQNQKAQLEADVNQRRSASNLQVEAQKMGMRPNPNPAFILLPDGKIVGTPTKVTGKEMPDQVYLTWQQAQKRQEDARAAVAREKAEAEAKRRAQIAAAKKKADDAAKKKKADEAAKQKADAAKKKAAEDAKKKAATRPSPSAAPTSPTSTSPGGQ